MNKNTHLAEEAIQLLDATDAERIENIRFPRWIGYPSAALVFERLKYIYSYPRMHRMPNALIVGDTNNGKTMIAHRFIEQVKRQEPPDKVDVPVLMVSSPTSCESGHLYASILRAVDAPFSIKHPAYQKEHQVISVLKNLQVKMIFIDEVHEVVGGGALKQRHILNTIKNLTNETRIPVIGLGTHDALRAVQVDPQIANRFRPIILPKWEMDVDYLRLLATYERVLPLKKPSNLTGKLLSNQILKMSEGLMGEISTILIEAACSAVRTGKEKITEEALDEIEWSPPSKRSGTFG